MAEGSPRIRMPKVSMPSFGRSKAAKTTEAAEGNGATEPATKEKAVEAPTQADPAAKKAPEPNMQERMEGLQGWMAEIERKQGRMTYFGAAAACLAVVAAGAALYLAVTTPNSASKDDFDDLEAQVETLQEEVAQATTDQNRLKALNASIQSLNTRLAAAEQKATQQASEIAAAKAQAQAAQQSAATATPAPTPAPTTPTTPGATKQP
jgi:chromosome segregation ATPase